MNEFLVERIILPVMVVILCVLIFIGVPYVIYATYMDFKKETFTLRKDSWVCTEHRAKSLIMTKTGAVMTPTSSGSECAQWSRK